MYTPIEIAYLSISGLSLIILAWIAGGLKKIRRKDDTGSSTEINKLNKILVDLENMITHQAQPVPEPHPPSPGYSKEVKNLLLDLITIKSDTEEIIQRLENDNAKQANGTNSVQTIKVIDLQLLGVLERHGVTGTEERIGSKYDASRQKVANTVRTDKQDQHLKVASIEKCGYEFAGKLLKPALVKVFKYTG